MSKINKKHETYLQTIVQDLDGSISDMAYIVFNILERKKNLIPTQSKDRNLHSLVSCQVEA